MKFLLFKLLFCCFCFSLFAPQLWAQDQSTALDQAAKSLFNSQVAKYQEDGIVLEVVNFHSQKMDALAKKLESGLYLALEGVFPRAKLILLSEVTAGVNLHKTTVIKASYEPLGNQVLLRLKATRGLGGALLGQAEVQFEHQTKRRRTLVAVLDIESQSLNATQKKIFSDIFRSALKKQGRFDLASSADVSKMDPDAIQQTYKCSRDECGTIIGRELGVDRVISVNYGKIAEGMFFLTAKVINIEQGSMGATESLEHDGNLKTFKPLLEKMAQRIAGQEGQVAPTPKNGEAQLSLSSTPPGAAVLFDGEPKLDKQGNQVTTPVHLDLPPGRYKITLNLPGYQSQRFRTRLRPGPNQVDRKLSPADARVQVQLEEAHPGALIYGNGQLLGQMGPKKSQIFQVPVGVRLGLQAVDGKLKSELVFLTFSAGDFQAVQLERFKNPDQESPKFGGLPAGTGALNRHLHMSRSHHSLPAGAGTLDIYSFSGTLGKQKEVTFSGGLVGFGWGGGKNSSLNHWIHDTLFFGADWLKGDFWVSVAASSNLALTDTQTLTPVKVSYNDQGSPVVLVSASVSRLSLAWLTNNEPGFYYGLGYDFTLINFITDTGKSVPAKFTSLAFQGGYKFFGTQGYGLDVGVYLVMADTSAGIDPGSSLIFRNIWRW